MDRYWESNQLPTASQRRKRFNDRVRRYLKMLGARWWLILLLVSAGICIQAWKLGQLPEEYRSNAQIVVAGQLTLKDQVYYREEMANFYGTAVQILKSGELKRRVKQRVELLHKELPTAPVHLVVERLKGSSVFDIEVRAKNGLYARAYLNALLDEYINFRGEMRSNVSENALDAIAAEMARAEKKLETSRTQLLAFQTSNNVIVLEEGHNSSAAYLRDLKAKSADLKTEASFLRRLDIDQDILRRSGATASDSEEGGVPIVALVDSEKNFLAKKQEMDVIRAEIAHLQTYLKARHPKIIALQQKLAKSDMLLAIYREQSQEQNLLRIRSLDLEIENLSAEIEEREAKALAMRAKLNEHQVLLAEVARDKSSYEHLLQRMQDVSQSQNLTQDSVSIMERASVASLVQRDRVRPITLGAMAGLVLAAVLLLAMDRLDDKIHSVSDFFLHFNEELLGVIPAVPCRKKERVKPLEPGDSRHLFSEAYRNLRSSLLFKNWKGDQPRTFLVTSAVPVEGKTTVAMNLSITMALTGSRVLLVDGDLRRGSLSRQFQFPPDTLGLGNIIAGEAKVEDCATPTIYENLALLSKGRDLPNCSENFLQLELRECLRDALNYFDFVIIDSAPVLVADDTTTLAPLIDTTLFVMRFNVTPARLAERALEQLYNRQVNVGGVILDCEDVPTSDYRAYGYYNYYATEPKPPEPTPPSTATDSGTAGASTEKNPHYALQ